MAENTKDAMTGEIVYAPPDPSIFNTSADGIRNVDLELLTYGYEECAPDKKVGPSTKGHYKIHYVHRGKGIIKHDGRTFQVGEGDCFVFFPDDLVYYESDPNDPWVYSWVGFEGANAGYYMKRANISEGKIMVEVYNREVLEMSFNELMGVSLDDPNKDLKYISLLYLILSAIQPEESAGSDQNNLRQMDMYVKTAIKYIQENYADPNLSVAQIAAHLSLERKYFSRIFKENVDVTPNVYLTEYRMTKACELLEDPEINISEISEKVGYENPFSFSRAFKNSKGISPRDYRKAKTGEEA